MSHSRSFSRRAFLQFMGRTGLVAGSTSIILSDLACAVKRASPGLAFSPLSPSSEDQLLLAEGFNYKILIKWNDPINKKEVFGTNNDFLAYTPLEGKTNEGVLWVNHEIVHPALFHGKKINGPRTMQEVVKEQDSVGGSLLHIRKTDTAWEFVPDSKYNRRLTGRTIIPFQKGYKIRGSSTAMGTFANCAGGQTPWNTILTCEENYDKFYGEAFYENKVRRYDPKKSELGWQIYFQKPPEHYGWVVEVDPFTGKAVKRNALGRFEHEGAKVQMSERGYPVVYMGEDRKGGFIYKFISSHKNSLEKGTLYVANTEKGIWIPLDLKKNKDLRAHFNNQQDVLTYTHVAARVAGGTPQDRPEDIEIDPLTGDIFIALTNNMDRNNPMGSLYKISEKNKNYESLEFKGESWLHGGLDTGFASPDNMVFDNKGNLWLTVDMDWAQAHLYKDFGNNGLYYIPLRGPHAGKSFLVATAPKDAEFTGPLFSEDYKTLFLSVQHPGEATVDPASPTSRWPEGPGHLPKSAVVTISGPALERLTQG